MNLISAIKKVRRKLNARGQMFFSRRRAHAARKKIIQHKGGSVVDRKTKREIKSYAKERFGSSSFWPWLAVYTELRGEFIPGWIPHDYYKYILLHKYNPEKAQISEYKTFDFRMFPNFALQPLLVKIGPNYYDEDNRKLSAVQARELLRDHKGEVVVKKDLSGKGHQVYFVESRELNLEDYAHIPSYIIQPVIEQAKQLQLFSRKSVNTVRVFTFLDKKGEAQVKYAILRFGLGDSRVDNISSGGGYVFVNPSGFLDKEAYNKIGISIGDRHPENGVLFESVRVPNYRAMVDKCRQCHEQFPYLKIIGWDVAVNQRGEPVLLEWNSTPVFGFQEALIGPMFKKEDFKCITPK